MSDSIILVSNTSWYIYNFRLGVIKFLQEKGYRIIVIGVKDDYTDRLIQQGCFFVSVKIEGQGKNPLKELKLIFRLIRIYKKYKPFLIFHYTIKPNIYGSIAAFISQSKSISVVSGAGYIFLKNNIFNIAIKKLYRFSQRLNAWTLFVNNEDKELFLKEGIVDSHKIDVLPGEGVNTAVFLRRTPYCANGDSFRFLLSARLLWDKGVGVYAEAARILQLKYRNVEFLLLGFLDVENPSAIPRSVIEEWVKSNTLKYLGTTDSVIDFLEKIDCFVLPSNYREGVPRALLEAACMELPIITTDNVGCRDVVEDNVTGYLCKKKDVSDLVEKMELMLNLPINKRIEMGKRGRERVVKMFDEVLVLKKYEVILDRIANRHE